MLFELIATIAAGFAAAGVALLAGKLSGGRLPRWIVPVTAGGAMLAFAVWSEYSWYERTSGALPEDVILVSRSESRAPWRPWTYLAPLTDRFAVLDTGSVKTNAAIPEQRLAEMYAFARWEPARRLSVAFDCAQGLSAPMIEGVSLDVDGRLINAAWQVMAPDDPALSAVCKGS